MATPLINGESYSWADVDFTIGRTNVVGIDAINYEDEQVIEDNYGQGRFPVSRGRGNIPTTASITLHAAEIEALQNTTTTGRIQDIKEFDILVSFARANGQVVKHKLKNCRFMNNARSMAQGDTKVATELQLKVSHIIWNA